MHKTEIQYNSETKRHYFVICDETGTELFQSGEWNTEKECRDGLVGFAKLCQDGRFDANTKLRERKSLYYYQYVSDDKEVWGEGVLRKSMQECSSDYLLLMKLMEEEAVVEEVDSIPLDPNIINFLFSLDGADVNSEINPTDAKQWEIVWGRDQKEKRQFELWSNDNIRNKFTKKYFKDLPKAKSDTPAGKEEP